MDTKYIIAIIVGVIIVVIIGVIIFRRSTKASSVSVSPVPVIPAQVISTPVPKFERKYSCVYAYGMNPGESGGGGNITYLGKAETPEACESKCASNDWCNAYTSYDSNPPYKNDCYGMRVVPKIEGVTNLCGNGAAMSGVKIDTQKIT